MRLHTIQLGKWRTAEKLGVEVVDITAKSGNRYFAPSPEDLFAYKRGEIDWPEYKRRYIARMVKSAKARPDIWFDLMYKDKVAIACYCPEEVNGIKGRYCHRYILVDLYEKYCAYYGNVFERMGEIR